MNPMIWLLVGGFLGWLTCVELGSAGPQDRVLNIVAGACGALATGWLLSTALGADVISSGEFSLGGLVAAAFGAIVLLVLVNLVRLLRIP